MDNWFIKLENIYCPFRASYDKDAWSSNWSTYIGCSKLSSHPECNIAICPLIGE